MPKDDFYAKMFQKAEFHSRKVTRDYQLLDRRALWQI